MSVNFDKEHDDYKLDTPQWDKVECDHCEELFEEDDVNEVWYRDADRDKRCLWLCEKCEEKQPWV